MTTASMDAGKSAEQLYAERAKRLQDAAELRQPDRIPVMLGMGYKLAELGGITRKQLHDDPELAHQLLEQAALTFQPDTIMGVLGGPEPSRILGDRMTRWPGYGLDDNGSFQFVEHEFMKADEYDAFLDDMSDWAIRVYLPRAFEKLEGFSLLPPLGTALEGYAGLFSIGALTAPPIAAGLQALLQAAEANARAAEAGMRSMQRLAALGFPPVPFFGVFCSAPFDFMSDTLRGMRGIMLDMLRQPDKLLAAEEKVARMHLKKAYNQAAALGTKYIGFMLHRGSDGFMSLAQFERFYWPQLKAMFLDLIDHGLTPFVFYEGVWDQRLHYLAELPKGKTVGMFQSSNIFKVKEIVGDTMCIIGGMPNSLLKGGTVTQVREYTHKLCEVVGKGGGYIMTTAVGELEGCQPELIKAWIDATREFGVYDA